MIGHIETVHVQYTQLISTYGHEQPSHVLALLHALSAVRPFAVDEVQPYCTMSASMFTPSAPMLASCAVLAAALMVASQLSVAVPLDGSHVPSSVTSPEIVAPAQLPVTWPWSYCTRYASSFSCGSSLDATQPGTAIARPQLPIRATSAGGGDSTVKDLLALANALGEHKLRDAERTKLLTTGKAETPGGGKYAYGMFEQTTDGERCVGHGGGAPGMNGDLSIRDSGYTIAVLANLDPPAADRISRFIAARLPAK